MYVNRIRSSRKLLKISQEDLAKSMNVTHWVISDWECGRSQPTLEQCIKLADFFETSIDYLFDCDHTKTMKEYSIVTKYTPKSKIEFSLLTKIQNMNDSQIDNLNNLLSILTNFNKEL